MSPPISRRVLLAVAASAALSAVAVGACGGDFGSGFGDGGLGGDGTSPSDMSSASSDLGAVGDGGAPGTQVTLTTPAPFESMVSTSTTFQFLATLPSAVTVQQLEAVVQIAPRGVDGGAALSGAFNWQSTGPSRYQLNFLPAALPDNTDYSVVVGNPTASGGPPLLKTGISTGSHPRVAHATLNVKAGAAAVGYVVTFSEAMDPTSVIAHLQLTANGVVVPAAVAAMAGSTRIFTLEVTSPHNLKMPLVLSVQPGVSAGSTMALDPASWDSMTAVGGAFEWQPMLPPSLDTLTTDLVRDFVPTVN